MKKLVVLTFLIAFCASFKGDNFNLKISKEMTLDSLGACQGVSYQNGKIYLYGDREVGMMREFKLVNDSLVYQHKEYKFTVDGKDIINHPTGIAYNGVSPVFI